MKKSSEDPENILSLVIKHSGIAKNILKGTSRIKEVSEARALYYLICKEHGITMIRTAGILNKNHHTAFNNAMNLRKNLLEGYGNIDLYNRIYDELEDEFNEQSNLFS